MRVKSDKCSRCRIASRAPNGRYCAPCKAAYMRGWRTTHALTPEQRFKQNARTYTHIYVKRGKLLKTPCEVCGEVQVMAFHNDYTKPLDVRWLCKAHHLDLRNKLLKP